MDDRPYQLRLYDDVRKAIAAGNRRVLVVVPTGGGKGYMAARILEMTAGKGKSSLFFAAQRELIHQLAKHMRGMDVPFKTIMSGVKDEYEGFEQYMSGDLVSLCAKDTLWARAFRSQKIEIPDANVVHIDECLSGDTVVNTPHGNIRLDMVSVGDTVLSLCNGRVTYRKVLRRFVQGSKPTIKIRCNGQLIRCTANHLIRTQRGWVKAESLAMTDSLLSVSADAERSSSGILAGGCQSGFAATRRRRLRSGSWITRNSLNPFRFASVVAGKGSILTLARLRSLLNGKEHDPIHSTEEVIQRENSTHLLSRPAMRLRALWGHYLGMQACCMDTGSRPHQDYRLITAANKSLGSGIKRLSCLLSVWKLSCSRTKVTGRVHAEGYRRVSLGLMKFTRPATATGPSESVSSGWKVLGSADLHGGSVTTGQPAVLMGGCISKGLTAKVRRLFTAGSRRSSGNVPCANIEATYTSESIAAHSGSCALQSESLSQHSCSTRWVPIESIESGDVEPVFDIEVEKSHCFFANGVLVHNCHGAIAKTYQAITRRYWDAIHIGWTATPCRSDNKPLGSPVMDENGVLLGPMYQSMVLGPSYRELQGDGFLVPVRAVAPDRPDLKGLKSRAGDYSKESLEKRMNRDEMVGSIVEEWKRHSDGRTTVLFASGIQHSIHCRNVFRTVGVTAEHIDGTMETAEREDILERTRDGKVRVLCNYGVLTTGVDIPELKYLICARPTKSFSLWRQMGGRIQRPAPGHDHCFIQDHSDNCLVFGYPDEDVEWDLFGEEDQGKKHQENQRKKKGEDGKPQGDPFQCEKCKTPYRGPHCPNCGTKHERRGKDLEMQAGELKALERERTNRNATPMDKQKFWDECLGWAVGTGRKVGAAAHRYKEKFGVFPSAKVMNVPRNSQWQMKAKDFYMDVVKPQKEALAQELAREQA